MFERPDDESILFVLKLRKFHCFGSSKYISSLTFVLVSFWAGNLNFDRCRCENLEMYFLKASAFLA